MQTRRNKARNFYKNFYHGATGPQDLTFIGAQRSEYRFRPIETALLTTDPKVAYATEYVRRLVGAQPRPIAAAPLVTDPKVAHAAEDVHELVGA